MGAVLMLTTLSAPGQAQEMESDQIKKGQEEAGQEIPTLEFLEFLGEWETEDGRWIDPEELEQMTLPDRERENEEEDETN
jgi:hypothetical protein